MSESQFQIVALNELNQSRSIDQKVTALGYAKNFAYPEHLGPIVAREANPENSQMRTSAIGEKSLQMNSIKQIQQVTSGLEPLLDEKEAARFLGVAKSTPGCWRRATPVVGPAFVVVEGRIRYSPEDLRCYVAGNRRDPATEVEKEYV